MEPRWGAAAMRTSSIDWPRRARCDRNEIEGMNDTGPDRCSRIRDEDQGVEMGNPALVLVRRGFRRATRFALGARPKRSVRRGRFGAVGLMPYHVVIVSSRSNRDDCATDMNMVVVVMDEVKRRDDDECAPREANEHKRKLSCSIRHCTGSRLASFELESSILGSYRAVDARRCGRYHRTIEATVVRHRLTR